MRKKGIAIQTILLLLVGILVVGIIVYMVYRYFVGAPLSEQECRARVVSWCTSCKTIGWSGGYDLPSEVASCANDYLGYSVTKTASIDCDDSISTGADGCTSTTCPNVTICRAVGIA